ncbi:serine/threonine protein kinase [Actinomadura barringtoniae]|uniref:Serine/threonine protein kinase n=1 Tax=Actinomadura barringtoniae TaxID=1427535 RepID=A0A939T521_9ACTN|nr:serine/threonine-protein kinase [Actinomadura barringtoniae]MBO2448989.1 serine/threonine protein kinase [Actinomadura barringtoniae]
MARLRPDDPQRLGTYYVIKRLGEGGQGVVFLARDLAGTSVAIKLLHADLTATARRHFTHEVGAARKVAKFCTAQVLAADVEGGRPYIVSEYVPGPSLAHEVDDIGPLRGGVLDRLAIGTATALVAIHQAGIVHRDLKPANVILGPDGPRVIDFGLARALDATVTDGRATAGTPAYMSPEQFTGKGISRATDVFAWAATIAYASTGSPVFGSGTLAVLMYRVLHDEPSLDGVPSHLRGLILRCLAKEPAQRPTAQRVLTELLGMEADSTPSELPAAVLTQGVVRADARRRPRATPLVRRISLTAIAASIAATAAVGYAAAGRTTEHPQPPRTPAPSTTLSTSAEERPPDTTIEVPGPTSTVTVTTTPEPDIIWPPANPPVSPTPTLPETTPTPTPTASPTETPSETPKAKVRVSERPFGPSSPSDGNGGS